MEFVDYDNPTEKLVASTFTG